MLAPLIRLLLALACGALVLSLPIMRTTAGALLRRVAATCFILALLPSLLVGLFSTGAGVRGGETSGVATLGCAAMFVVLALVAYGVLQLRARFRARAKPRDPWDALFGRSAGKHPFYRAAAQRRIRLVDEEDDV